MEALTVSLQENVSITIDPLDTSRPHPRLTHFKQKREGYGDQEARRARILEEQRSRRRDLTDYARKIAFEEYDDDMEDGGHEVDADDKLPDSKKQRSRSRRNTYKNQLMLSEWLVDVPGDFEENWYAIICPIAKRCLVISAKGTTTAYSRSGYQINRFPSLLPGGCRKRHFGVKDYCILDCFFHESLQSFFVFDIMCWRGHPVYDCDTEFRLYWLTSKLGEAGDDLLNQTTLNPYKFMPLEFHNCTMSTLSHIFSIPYPIEVDGVLFLHKSTHYVLGRSPLALWLKPHMIPMILNIPVTQEFLNCAPTLQDAKMETEKLVSRTSKRKQTAMDISVEKEHTKMDT